ncbi:phage major capsid protein [uncultured Alsobacter sp.]|uniref:phage major capsid protein n=1 Tax=uncultured Alsobacter sp. TaxID=1748258 RepID=UPI0025DDCAEC|nr:phage major capsid protein [uncultured Alsobacter sp.]
MTLEQLRARLKELTEANEKTLKSAADEKRRLTAEEIKAVDDATVEAEGIQKEIELLKRANAVKAASAVPANTPVDPAGRVAPTPKRATTTEEKVGVVIKGLLMSHKDKSKTPLAHMDELGYGEVAKEIEFGTKALNASTAISGGLLIPTDMSSEIIELLRPSTAFLRGGPMRIPMPNGSYTLPGAATGASASYTTESQPAGVTEQTFRDVTMNAKTLTALIPVTNDLLNYSIAGTQQFVQTDLINAMSEKMDSAAFRGDGVTGNPLGIYNITGISSNAAQNTTTPSVAQVDADLRKAINAFVTANMSLAGAAWVFPATTIGYLQDMRDGNGNLVYPTLNGPNPTLKNIPVIDTTNMPTNLGGGDETIVGLVNFRHILFGESMPLELAVSSEAAIEVGGQVLSTFQRRMTAIMAVMQHDFNTRHYKAISLLTAVRWGK